MRPSPSFFLSVRSSLAGHNVSIASKPHQRSLEAAYYRGGTSRAVIIQPRHLPKDRAQWPSIFRQIIGSGDPYGRQLDGMGAGISSLSKICLVEPYDRKIASSEGSDISSVTAQAALAREEVEKSNANQAVDIDYTFVGLGIENDEVDVAGNCGNMSSAIGPYAYNAELLAHEIYEQGDGEVTVSIRNTNTRKVINSTFAVVGGKAAVVGDYTIDGVTGAGPKIKLDFKTPYGSKTGKVLPTGQAIESVAGYGVSCVDGANPAVFIRADDIGVDGTILPNDFNKLSDKLALLEQVRKSAAVRMGIASTEDEVPRTVPKIGLVSRSSSHSVLSGHKLNASEVDIVIRFISDGQPHRAIPLTAALTTAVAARIPGTIVQQRLAPKAVVAGTITIGHASGRLEVNATMDEQNKGVPKSATVYRTAKRLFEGQTFWIEKDMHMDGFGTTYTSRDSHSLGLAFVLETRGQSSARLFPDESTEKQQQPAEEQESLGAKQERNIQVGQVHSLDQEHGSVGAPQMQNQPPRVSRSSQDALTEALQHIQGLIIKMLDDPINERRHYPRTLLSAIKNSSNKILTHDPADNPQILADNWHRLAKNLREYDKKKMRGAAKEKREDEKKMKRITDKKMRKMEMILAGTKKQDRANLGIDEANEPAWDNKVTDAKTEPPKRILGRKANAKVDDPEW